MLIAARLYVVYAENILCNTDSIYLTSLHWLAFICSWRSGGLQNIEYHSLFKGWSVWNREDGLIFYLALKVTELITFTPSSSLTYLNIGYIQLHCTHKIHYLHKGAVQDSASTLLNQPCWFNSCNFVLSFTGNSIHWVCSKLRDSPHFWKSDLRCTIIKPECWNQALLIP